MLEHVSVLHLFFMNDTPFEWPYHTLSIHLLMDIGRFHLSALTNSAAVNIHARIFVPVINSLRVELLIMIFCLVNCSSFQSGLHMVARVIIFLSFFKNIIFLLIRAIHVHCQIFKEKIPRRGLGFFPWLLFFFLNPGECKCFPADFTTHSSTISSALLRTASPPLGPCASPGFRATAHAVSPADCSPCPSRLNFPIYLF